jgi:hypothetical protein
MMLRASMGPGGPYGTSLPRPYRHICRSPALSVGQFRPGCQRRELANVADQPLGHNRVIDGCTVRIGCAPGRLVEPTPQSRPPQRRGERLQQRYASTHTHVVILCCSAPCSAPHGSEPLDSAKPRSRQGATASTPPNPPTDRAEERHMR